MFDNPIVAQSTQWNGFDRAGGGASVYGVDARLFQISAVEDNVLDCVTWDDQTSTAGTQITYVAKPSKLDGNRTTTPEYKVNDIITGIRLQHPIVLDLDDDTSWDCYWQDANVDGRNTIMGTVARLVADVNVTISGAQTIDGNAVATDDIVLLTAQSTSTQNGLYKVNTAGAWTTVVPINATFAGGTMVSVAIGAIYFGTAWICTNSGLVQQGTTVQSWRRIQDANLMWADIATTTNALPSGYPTIDGIPVSDYMRVLFRGFVGDVLYGVFLREPAGWVFIGQPYACTVTFGDTLSQKTFYLKADSIASYTTGDGTSGYSGYSGLSGYSGSSGTSGVSGKSGYSGYSGGTGSNGSSGFSGMSGASAYSGSSGFSGNNNSNPFQVADICSFTSAGTNNVTLSGSQTVDGQSSSTNTLLITDQTTAGDNGLYVANTGGAWAKQTPTPNFVAVKTGTLNARVCFVLTAANTWKPVYGVLK